MRVSDLMKKEPPFCVPFDTAQRAASAMKHYDVHFISIVENEPTHMLVGVVTDRDLCLRVVAEGKDPNEVKLADCMSNDPVLCHPQDDISKAIPTDGVRATASVAGSRRKQRGSSGDFTSGCFAERSSQQSPDAPKRCGFGSLKRR